MTLDFIKVAVLICLILFTGILGLIWLLGDHASIYIAIGVKPLGALMLAISCIMFRHMRVILRKYEK